MFLNMLAVIYECLRKYNYSQAKQVLNMFTSLHSEINLST